MKIGGFQKLSLVDFPGHTAAVIFTQGCNLQCPWCHNKALISCQRPATELVPEEKVLDFLTARQHLLDGVVVTGGEPTLQPDLIKFLEVLRLTNLRIKLDSNGLRPKILAKILEENLVDFIAMDIKAPLESYSKITGIRRANFATILDSIKLIADSDVAHQFRTTHVEHLLSDAEMSAIQDLVPLGSDYVVNPYIPPVGEERILYS